MKDAMESNRFLDDQMQRMEADYTPDDSAPPLIKAPLGCADKDGYRWYIVSAERAYRVRKQDLHRWWRAMRS